MSEASVELPITRITVAPGRRPLGDPEMLARSIREVGRLLQPVVVNKVGRGDRDSYRLVAGLTRLEAVRLLGWKRVAVTVVELDAASAELAELDENLARTELTAVQRARLTWRRQQVYERKYPQSRSKVAGGLGRQRGGGGGDSAGATIAPAESPPAAASFADDTALRTGRAGRTVQLDAQVGRLLGEPALDVIERTPLANNRTELLKLARIEPVRRSASCCARSSGAATRR